MNLALTTAARAAITNPKVTAEKGMCSRFVRQVCEEVYGEEVAALFGDDALSTMHLFQRYGYSVRYRGPQSLLSGDILFKSIEPHGHVGIYVGHETVAENSSSILGRVCGAKGYRSLEAFGVIAGIGRLPSPGEGIDPLGGLIHPAQTKRERV